MCVGSKNSNPTHTHTPTFHMFQRINGWSARQDKYDVTDASAGVCTDVHVAYGNTGCESAGGAKATLSVIGCTGRATGWSQDFCGALVETTDSDFVAGVSIAESSLEYPRTLVPETQVNGKVELPVTCSDVEDCVKKCEFFSFNARDGGLPSPEACALCDPPCPDNLATTAIDLAVAVRHDTESALRLAAVCQESVAACACQPLDHQDTIHSHHKPIAHQDTIHSHHEPLDHQDTIHFHHEPMDPQHTRGALTTPNQSTILPVTVFQATSV